MDFIPSVAPPPSAEEPRAVRRPGTYQSVQALRGVAAILVTIFHAGLKFDTTQNTFRIGNAGVDIFFIISGFVIWTVTTRRPTPPLTFLAHRAVRLVPMYWIMTLLMTAGALLVPSAFPHLHPTGSDVVLSMLFIPHMSASNGLGEPVLGQGWTLNYEVFFYLVFSVVLLLPLVARFWAMLATLAVLGTVGVVYLTPPPVRVLGLVDPLLFEFMGGLCIARLAATQWRPHVAISWVMVVLGVAMLAFLAAPATGDDAARVIAYGIPAFLIVGGAVGLESAGQLRVPAWAKLLGASSYSLYLTHTFVISALGKVWPASLGLAGFIFVATVGAMLVGIVAYAVLENPLLSLMRGKGLPRPASLFAPN